AMREVMAAGSPEDKAARQTELAKEAFERAIANMRELAEMVTKAQTEANEVITKRGTESLDEMKDLLAKKRAYRFLSSFRDLGRIRGGIRPRSCSSDPVFCQSSGHAHPLRRFRARRYPRRHHRGGRAVSRGAQARLQAQGRFRSRDRHQEELGAG